MRNLIGRKIKTPTDTDIRHHNVMMRQTLIQRMLMLSESDVKRCLNIPDCLEANRKAFQTISKGTSNVPTRIALSTQETAPTDTTQDWSLFKPAAYLPDNLMGMKVVSLRANNPAQGLPLAAASILYIDAVTGIVDAVVAGTYLTALRTSCGSALSCQIFKPDAKRIVCFGAGLQADLHVQAISTALDRSMDVTFINRNIGRAQDLKKKLEEENSTMVSNIDVIGLNASPEIHAALGGADIIVTCTNTTKPLFDGAFLAPGSHICGVGSYTPDMQEIGPSAVDRCRVSIDTPEAKLVGDLRHLPDNHPIALIGSHLAGDCQKEETTEVTQQVDCTLYKSVGTAIQDLLTADIVVQRARELGIGVEVDMS